MSDTAITTHTNAGYERALLGALLLGTVRAEQLAVEAADFWESRHLALYLALANARAAGVPAEPLAIAGWLAEEGSLAQVGGTTYLADVVAAASSADSAGWYAEKLAELTARRAIITTAAQLDQAAHNPGMDSHQLAAMLQATAAKAGPRTRSKMTDLGDFITIGLGEIELRADAELGLSTGFHDLDKMIPGGLRPGTVVSIAGPTSSGKTTLGLDIMRHMGIRQGAACALFTIEMTKQETFDKILSAESGIPLSSILSGKLTDSDWSNAARVAGYLAQAPISLREGSITVPEIIAESDALRDRWGRLDVVVVDYLQLVNPAVRRGGGTREQEVAEIMRQLKRFALDRRVVVIVMVQCNRGPSQRADKTPLLCDIRESGEVENSSNIVLMLYSESYYDPQTPRAGETDLWVRKNRFGPKDVSVVLAAQLHRSRFVTPYLGVAPSMAGVS